MGYLDYIPQAINVTYNNATTGIGTGDVQSALDSVSTIVATGPAGLSISSNVSTAISSTTLALMNGMTLSPTTIGNYAVIFTGQFTSVNDTTIQVFVNGVAFQSSIRAAAGSTGTHSFIMSLSDKVTVTAGQAIQIYWATSGNSTCLGRNVTAIKVT